MNYERYIATFFLAGFIITCCHSQTTAYGNVIPPTKVQLKFDSLYPHASNMAWRLRQKGENAQVISFDCNCEEGMGHLTITFDTNGTIMNKNTLISKQDLPATIIDYITNNYPNEFEYREVTKITTNSGELTYRVEMKQTVPDGNATNGWIYVLKFNGTGGFISQEKR